MILCIYYLLNVYIHIHTLSLALPHALPRVAVELNRGVKSVRSRVAAARERRKSERRTSKMDSSHIDTESLDSPALRLDQRLSRLRLSHSHSPLLQLPPGPALCFKF